MIEDIERQARRLGITAIIITNIYIYADQEYIFCIIVPAFHSHLLVPLQVLADGHSLPNFEFFINTEFFWISNPERYALKSPWSISLYLILRWYKPLFYTKLKIQLLPPILKDHKMHIKIFAMSYFFFVFLPDKKRKDRNWIRNIAMDK